MLLPAEERELRNLVTASDLGAFIESFWLRRAASSDAGSDVRATFKNRVEQADTLFSDGENPGGLTDRGRAFLLLGPPSALGQSYRQEPMLARGNLSAEDQRSEPVMLETWSWRSEDLEENLREQLAANGVSEPFEVRFIVRAGRYLLLGGEELLRMAARAWISAEDSR